MQLRHEALIKEFTRRKYNHYTPLNKKLAKGAKTQFIYINTVSEQKVILKKKGCECL